MKVYVYPADVFGCGLHRVIWPAQALQRAGYDVTIINPKERASALNGKLDARGNLIDVQVPRGAEVIVLQRITHKHLVTAIQILRNRGIAVVIDMDDDLSSINPNNPAFSAMHPKHGFSSDHNWNNTQLACEAATLVTVSTDALLQRYAPHGRGNVLRNCIPKRYLTIPRVDSTVVGWGGSLHSHPDDMTALGATLSRLVDQEDAQFRIVGPSDGIQRALRLQKTVEATGPRDPHDEWPQALNQLGIGIAPLASTKFNAAKSWLKPLEYAALGVPCVMSPSAEYTKLHELGVGLLARKPQQWLRHLRTLINSPECRAQLSEQGRHVASDLTIEGNASRWLDAWEKAYKMAH